MKTISKTIYYKEYKAPVAYGCNGEQVKSYVEVKSHFDFKEGLRFSVSSPNFSCCNHNIFKSMLKVLEHESIGMAKYDRIKDDSRRCGLWKHLDCKN